MADRDLIDLVDAPPPVSERALEMSRKNADWAGTFAPATRNLSQQRKYRADVQQNLADELATKEWQQAQELKTSKVAQDLYFKSQGLSLDRERALAELNERQQRMDFAKERLPEELKFKRAQTGAALALEESRRRKMEAETLMTEAQAKADSAFHEELKQRTMGGTDFKTAIRDAYIANPRVTKQSLADALKVATGEERNIDDVISEFEAARRMIGKDATVTSNARGTTITARPEKEQDDGPSLRQDRQFYASRVKELRDQRGSVSTDADRAEIDSELSRREQQLADVESRLGGGGAAPTTATAKPKAVRQNGVVYHLQPDGSYK